MAKIALSITENYCPHWDAWSGVREIVQNAIDAHEDGHEMEITHSARSNKLTVKNTSVVLDTRVLLLGGTMGKSDAARGQYREGLKIGCLALVRLHCPVTIYSGDEVWRPDIEPSDTFAGQKVLVINTRKLQNTREDFTVEVENISKEVWQAIEKRFLFIKKPSPNATLVTHEGTVLLQDDYKGYIYSRGIYVTTVPDLDCGYDLAHLKLDRDRKVVDSWDLRYRLAELWGSAVEKDPERHTAHVYAMAKSGKEETRAMRSFGSATLAKALRKELEKEHGEGAVPVCSILEAQKAEEMGVKAVLVDAGFKELLEKDGQTMQAMIESRRRGVKQRFLLSDLTSTEEAAVKGIVGRFADLSNVVVVEFNDPNLMGQFEAEAKQLQFSRVALSKDPRELARMAAAQEALRCGRQTEEVLLDALYPVKSVPEPETRDDHFGIPI